MTFTSWGRPFILRSSHFASPVQPAYTHGSLPIQVECGWDFTAVLTQTGDVFVYWPRPVSHDVVGTSNLLGRHVHKKNDEFNNLEGPERKLARAELDAASGTVKCWVWSVDCDAPSEQQQGPEQNEGTADQEERGQTLVKLPDLPLYELPDLHAEGSEDRKEEGTKLIKIAGLDRQVVGLTNKGHVVRFRWLANEEDATAARRKWEYVSLHYPLLTHTRADREPPFV